MTEILNHVSPAEKKALASHANKFGAASAIYNVLGWRGGGLLDFADTVVPRHTRRLVGFQRLSPKERGLNVAERLVVAFRIEEKVRERGPLK